MFSAESMGLAESAVMEADWVDCIRIYSLLDVQTIIGRGRAMMCYDWEIPHEIGQALTFSDPVVQ
jgi:hypothetical protein